MGWELAPHVSFCVASDRVLFLDVRHDRYFALPGTMSASFRAWLESGGRADHAPPAIPLLVEAGLLRATVAAVPLQPVNLAIPTRSLPKASAPATRLAALRAWTGAHASLYRTRRRLRADGLHGLIAHARTARPGTPLPPRPFALGFQFARGPRALEGDCLPASFAMLDFLHRRGSDARAVFGVIANPFRAHCWLQSETEILNDDVDHVRAFTPILVL